MWDQVWKYVLSQLNVSPALSQLGTLDGAHLAYSNGGIYLRRISAFLPQQAGGVRRGISMKQEVMFGDKSMVRGYRKERQR